MKKSIYLILSLSVILIMNACSSVKVLNTWKAENAKAVNDNNFIVIARTDNLQARIAFENEIVDQLKSRGIKATASFNKFPDLKPDVKVTEENEEAIKKLLTGQGFNGVVLTVIKDTQELSKTVTDGGYYAGSSYYGYYPRYYVGFYGYYRHPKSYSSYGTYVQPTSTTHTETNYILETLIYNLEDTKEKQLVAVVTSKIEDPENASTAAEKYVKAISKSFDEK